MNLVSMALQYLTPVLVGKLASSLGVNSTIANTIVRAAIPAILGALVGKAAKPEGARALFDVLAKQDTGLLGRLSSVLGSPQQKTIAEQGSNALGSLLGMSSLGSLVNAVSKYANVDTTATTGVVGMLAPVVLGTLSQQQKSSNLDAGGLAKLLGDQKANIASAIPADLSRMLAGSGLLDAVVPKAVMAPPPVAVPQKPFNGWPWAALVAAASLLWGSWFGGEPSPWADVPPPPRLMAGTTDVAGELDTTLKSLYGLLATVKDKASAEAAAPQLRLAQTQLDRLDAAARKLPADSRRILGAYISVWQPVITPVMTTVLANTSTSPIVKPMVDALRGKLDGLTKA